LYPGVGLFLATSFHFSSRDFSLFRSFLDIIPLNAVSVFFARSLRPRSSPGTRLFCPSLLCCSPLFFFLLGGPFASFDDILCVPASSSCAVPLLLSVVQPKVPRVSFSSPPTYPVFFRFPPLTFPFRVTFVSSFIPTHHSFPPSSSLYS